MIISNINIAYGAWVETTRKGKPHHLGFVRKNGFTLPHEVSTDYTLTAKVLRKIADHIDLLNKGDND